MIQIYTNYLFLVKKTKILNQIIKIPITNIINNISNLNP